jgi:Ca2+-binding EF-hand superfamily protein
MKKYQIVKSVLALSLALALPMEAMAFFNPSEFDTNNDGKLTTQELQAGLTAQFAKIDTNADKYLSLAEMQAWRNSVQVEHFNALDTDKSSSLSLAELQATTTQQRFPENMTEKLFNLLDSDANKVLSWEEYAVLEPGKGKLIRHFVEMDTDDDLQISEAEYLMPPTRGQGGHGGHGGM